MSETTKAREAKTEAGRAYQLGPHSGTIFIDWTPASPIAGHKVLTRGETQVHPTEGTVITFKEKFGGKDPRKKHMVISARVSGRPDLEELARIATTMKAEIDAAQKAENEARKAEHATKVHADVAAFQATLPAGYIAIEHVDHNPGAADGWGMTDFAHGGAKLSTHEVHELGPKYHHPLGNQYQLLAYVPAAGLTALVDRKRAEQAEADATKAAKTAAREAARTATIQQARETGKPVELESWTEDCNDPREECSTDICRRLAMPDGTTKTTRTHTY
jgi:hypothetical protein